MDGGTYRGLMISAGGQVLAGHALGAQDRRLAREAVSNGMSPANGTDIMGMTAVFHSAAQACRAKLSGGTALNMNLNPLTLKTDESIEKLASLIEGYFELGGRQVQFNPMGRETLLDAQKNPGALSGFDGQGFRIFLSLCRPVQGPSGRYYRPDRI